MISLGVLLLAVGSFAALVPLRFPLDGRIVGGEDTEIDNYPWQLSLQSYDYHICGASIIGETWVLTAAHCVDGASPRGISFRAGSSIKGRGGQVRQAKRIIVHPKYGNLDFDFALVEVDQPFNMGPKVKAVKLADKEPMAGKPVTVSGWGALQEGGGSPSQLQKVDVNIVDRNECNSEYGGGITKRMICAAASGKDSCQGDSGGPLVSVDGIQLGVVSWGSGCARPGYAGVYSNIADQRDWIKQNTGI